MKERHPRSVLATWSLVASLLGPVLTVLGILCLMFVSSLPRPARHDLAWVEAVFQHVAIPSLILSPPLALLLGSLALAGIKRSGVPIRGKVLARCAIVVSVLTLCFLVWAVPTFLTAQRTAEANACGGNERERIEPRNASHKVTARCAATLPMISIVRLLADIDVFIFAAVISFCMGKELMLF